MVRGKRKKMNDSDLGGCKYFKLLAGQILDKPVSDLRREELDQVITLVDGSWMFGVADMLWVHFCDDNKNNAAKAHVWFELAKGTPVDGTITDANISEFKPRFRPAGAIRNRARPFCLLPVSWTSSPGSRHKPKK